MIEIVVNGETRKIAEGETVERLIAGMGLDRELVAVEVNRDLVRKTTFGQRRLSAGDQVEIVEFVGGG